MLLCLQGVDILVPGFIDSGTVVKMKTATGEYLERVRWP
jgi:hypothetical protein